MYVSALKRPRALVILLLTALPGCSSNPASWDEPLTGMEFVLIRAGDFSMGSPESEIGHEERENLHRATVTSDYYLGRYEVTQQQWVRVMGENPSHFAGCPSCPVERVNYHDVSAFIVELNRRSEHTFRLPTETEWEYACRAGTTTPFSTGENLTSRQANYDGRYPYPGNASGDFPGKTSPVGSYPPNDWDLHDLHGNVWEWTSSPLCPYGDGECDTELLVIRGGSWVFDADSARCALRYKHLPRDLGYSIGFRLVREID